MYRPATILGCWVALVATVGLLATGDVQGKLMFQQQPMKMASAESLCHTETDPNFSVLTVGTHNNCDASHTSSRCRTSCRSSPRVASPA